MKSAATLSPAVSGPVGMEEEGLQQEARREVSGRANLFSLPCPHPLPTIMASGFK